MLNSIITLVLCHQRCAEIIEDVHNAIKKEDHAEGIKDPKELLVSTVSHLSRLANPPGVLQIIIDENLDQSNKQDWAQICTTYQASGGL